MTSAALSSLKSMSHMSQTAISSFQVVLSPYLPNLIECVVELCLRFPANIENIQARNPPSWLTDVWILFSETVLKRPMKRVRSETAQKGPIKRVRIGILWKQSIKRIEKFKRRSRLLPFHSWPCEEPQPQGSPLQVQADVVDPRQAPEHRLRSSAVSVPKLWRTATPAMTRWELCLPHKRCRRSSTPCPAITSEDGASMLSTISSTDVVYLAKLCFATLLFFSQSSTPS